MLSHVYSPWVHTVTRSSAEDNYDLIDNGNGTRTLNLAVPGLRKEDLKLTQDGTVLKVETISGAPKGAKVIHKGIPDNFSYTFDIKGFRVEDAKCGDGVLQVLLSKVDAREVIRIK